MIVPRPTRTTQKFDLGLQRGRYLHHADSVDLGCRVQMQESY